MLPPIFKTLNTDAVREFVGTNPVRIYDFGMVPDGAPVPYVVFFQTAAEPYAQIGGAPDADRDTVQTDCYDTDPARLRRLARAVQDALDAAGQANRLIVQSYENDTQLYRIGFEVDWIGRRA